MRSYSITLIFTNFQNNNQLPRLHCNFLVLMLYHITHLECLFGMFVLQVTIYLGENVKDSQRIRN